jgi:hypothetical protein
VSFQRTSEATLSVRFSGRWRLRGGLPSASLIESELEPAPKVSNVAFDAVPRSVS